MTIPRIPDPGPDGHEQADAAEARAGLHRLAAHANTEPSHQLSTHEFGTHSVGSTGVTLSRRDDRFDWRRLAVAAGVLALVGGGAVALNQRSGDSEITPSANASIPGASISNDSGGQAGAAGFSPSLAAGFGPAPDSAADAGRYAQHQYAENVDRPEAGRYVTVTDAPGGGLDGIDYTFGDFYVTYAPGTAGTAPPTTGSPEAPVTTVPGLATTVPDEPFGATSAPDTLGEAGIATAPETTMTDAAGASAVPAGPDDQCQSDAGSDGLLPAGEFIISTGDGICRMATMTEVNGSAVVVFSSGLSDAEVESVIANLVPAPDGFGHVIDPDALPAGLTEIAAGSITSMFEPRPAIAETHRVELVWTYLSPPGNPVLDQAGLAEAKIVAIVDGDSGLAGQRLVDAEVRDAVVGDDPAVVQIGKSGSVRVVWRNEGTLFMYEEEMADADPDGTVRRANELLPFFVTELADGQYSPETPAPTTTVPECGPRSETTPPGVGATVPTNGATTVPADIATTMPACDWPTGTYPDESIPPDYSIPTTTYPDDWPGTEDPETTTTTTWPETTTTYPGQGDDWPTTTYPDDWSTTTYPGQGDDWPTTTTYPGQDNGDGPTPTTTQPDYGGVAPQPPVTIPPP